MSALGQKQTYAVQHRMSALPPIATAKADIDAPIDSRNEAARNKGRVTGRRQEVDGRMSLVTRLAARPIPILNLRVGLSS
jgi:hypothetical protein